MVTLEEFFNAEVTGKRVYITDIESNKYIDFASNYLIEQRWDVIDRALQILEKKVGHSLCLDNLKLTFSEK